MKFEPSESEVEIINAQKNLVRKLTSVIDDVIDSTASSGEQDRMKALLVAAQIASEVNNASRTILTHIDKSKNTMMKAEILDAARNGLGRAAGLSKLPHPRI